MLSIVTFPLYPSSWKRSAIRSASGKTVELPAETMSPLTSNGFTSGNIPLAAAGGASVVAVGSTAAVVAVGAIVGSAVLAQPVATRATKINTVNNQRRMSLLQYVV
jgi:hypothetical protein